MSGNPSLVEEAGFGSGEKGYASMQYAMSEYGEYSSLLERDKLDYLCSLSLSQLQIGIVEGDPLINQYASSAMQKVWEAAGLPLSAIQSAPTP